MPDAARDSSSPRGDERIGFPFGAIVALFTVAFLALAWPWLSGRVTIPWDAKAQFYPQLAFLAASFAKGESPFWAPHVFAGWPQIADPQSLIFSPLHVALAALRPEPSFRATDAVTFAYLFLGGLAMIAFFHDRSWHAGGALVAALMFAFGGSAASRLQHTGQIMSLAWLAIALWLLARALERRSWRWALPAGLAVGMLAIGRDQVALIGLYVLAGFVVAHWVQSPQPLRRIRETFVPLVATASIALLVAIVPLTLTALLAADSNRPEISFVDAGRGSLHPANLLMLVFGNLYGASMPDNAFWGPPSFAWKAAFGDPDLFVAQNMGQVYAGAVAPVAVLGIGIARGMLWTREVRFFAIALVLVLLYALGWYTPAFRAMYALLPGVDLFRRPADATFVFGFLLAIVTGYLVHCWVSGRAAALTGWRRATGVVIALAIVMATAIVVLAAGKAEAAAAPIASGVLCIVATVAILAAAIRVQARSALAAAAILGVVVAGDLAWNNGPNGSTGLPPEMYDALRPDTANETVALIERRLVESAAPDRRDRVELIGIGYHWPNLPLVHGFDHVLGHNPLRLRDFARATCVCDTVAVPDQRTFSPLFSWYRSVFADLLGLRVIATGVPVDQIDRRLGRDGLKLLAHAFDAFVYENPRALPRVMFVPGYRLADFDAMLSEGWPADADPRRMVLLDRAPAGVAPSGPASEGRARLVRYANTEIVIDVESGGAGFLLLNDVWHPWWYAEVDGAPVEILKANAIFRAVALAPGKHVVRFTFRPLLGAWKQVSRWVGMQ